MFGLSLQEISQYVVPLLLASVLCAAVLQQFLRNSSLQQQLLESQAELALVQEQLHEQDIDVQVLSIQQQQLQLQLQQREADYQQLKSEHGGLQEQLVQGRGVADAARAAYREIKEQQLLRDKSIAEQQRAYSELQKDHQQLQQDYSALSGQVRKKSSTC